MAGVTQNPCFFDIVNCEMLTKTRIIIGAIFQMCFRPVKSFSNCFAVAEKINVDHTDPAAQPPSNNIGFTEVQLSFSRTIFYHLSPAIEAHRLDSNVNVKLEV